MKNLKNYKYHSKSFSLKSLMRVFNNCLFVCLISIGLIIFSCSEKKTDKVVLMDEKISEQKDTFISKYSFDTILDINKNAVIFSIKGLNEDSVILFAQSKNRTYLNDTIDSNGLAFWEFIDVNKDGYLDFTYDYLGNNPTPHLYLFDPSKNKFKNIDGYMSYPYASKIDANIECYYSYSRAGCADLNWISELFTIDDYKINLRGRILGIGCPNENDSMRVEIYQIFENNSKDINLIQTLPIDVIEKHEDYKWDFISDYWSKNYSRFIK